MGYGGISGGVNTPTADQKAALAGTNGAPSNANRYVTDSDPRNSNARTPTAHQHATSDVNGLGTAATRNVPASGDAAGNEVVLGSDSRLARLLATAWFGDGSDGYISFTGASCSLGSKIVSSFQTNNEAHFYLMDDVYATDVEVYASWPIDTIVIHMCGFRFFSCGRLTVHGSTTVRFISNGVDGQDGSYGGSGGSYDASTRTAGIGGCGGGASSTESSTAPGASDISSNYLAGGRGGGNQAYSCFSPPPIYCGARKAFARPDHILSAGLHWDPNAYATIPLAGGQGGDGGLYWSSYGNTCGGGGGGGGGVVLVFIKSIDARDGHVEAIAKGGNGGNALVGSQQSGGGSSLGWSYITGRSSSGTTRTLYVDAMNFSYWGILEVGMPITVSFSSDANGYESYYNGEFVISGWDSNSGTITYEAGSYFDEGYTAVPEYSSSISLYSAPTYMYDTAYGGCGGGGGIAILLAAEILNPTLVLAQAPGGSGGMGSNGGGYGTQQGASGEPGIALVLTV